MRIRLAKWGIKSKPVFRIIAVDHYRKRDTGMPLEWLGWYNPWNKEAAIDYESIRKWLSVGAAPTDAVVKLFNQLTDPLPPPRTLPGLRKGSFKGKWREEVKEKVKEAREAKQAAWEAANAPPEEAKEEEAPAEA